MTISSFARLTDKHVQRWTAPKPGEDWRKREIWIMRELKAERELLKGLRPDGRQGR